MSSLNLDAFLPVFVMMAIAVALYFGALLAAKILSPEGTKSKLKSQAYECGEEAVGSAWSMFNVRFYVVGLIFILFDVESVLMFPVATIFNEMTKMGEGAYVLVVFLSFIFVLIEGIAYCWKKGDLDWVKSYTKTTLNKKK